MTLNHLFAILFIFSSCQTNSQEQLAQNKPIGGPCEGCEAIYEYGEQILIDTDTLPGYFESNPKIKLYGTVFQEDGKTSAENVIIYIYHTDTNGIYPKNESKKIWGQRHGYLRGWVKTGEYGKYSFYTIKPASYPNSNEPAHIHMTVKEPLKNEYYIDEVVFVSDPKLTQLKKRNLSNRGGSGIVNEINKNDIIEIRRDIILGKNIPNYY